MALPNTGMDAVPFTPLTAEFLDDMIENIEALSDGSGFNTGAIDTASLADGAVTGAKTDGIWWEELGRVVLGADGDLISLTPFAAKKYLQVTYACIPATGGGTIGITITFNGDSSANYAVRVAINGATDVTAGSINSLDTHGSQTNTAQFGVIDILNIQNQEKFLYANGVSNANGAGSMPDYRRTVAKWSNTSAQITRIDLTNGGDGNYKAGSELVVRGHD